MQKVSNNKMFMYLSLVIFCIITIPQMLHHVPWFDEYWDWILTKDLTLANCVPLMRQNGHFMLWYLLVMPLSRLNFAYPYSLLWINWIFYFLAIWFMWKKAPFNDYAKVIITFSYISTNYLPIVARCYSIGVLFLFIIASLYREQTKRPILYSILLILAAHTSFLVAIVVMPLAVIFLYYLITDRQEVGVKNIVISSLILFLGGFIWLLPFIDIFYTQISTMFHPDFKRILTFFAEDKYFSLLCFIVSSGFFLVFSDAKVKILYFTVLLEYCVLFSYLYPAMPHLNLFLIVYVIFAYWLTPKLHDINPKTITFLVFFGLLLLYRIDNQLKYIFDFPTDKAVIAKYINAQPQRGFIFATWQNTEMIPYINDFHYICVSEFCAQDHDCVKKEINEVLEKDGLYQRAYYISTDKINNSSQIFEFPNAEYNKELYVTAFDKGKK